MSNAFNLISVYAQSSALEYAYESINLRIALMILILGFL